MCKLPPLVYADGTRLVTQVEELCEIIEESQKPKTFLCVYPRPVCEVDNAS